ncbi:MAG TPA: SIMPL domain-containing protein [Vicinamibacterales bacterium]|nr:SIMPL domain-containing protein [Vicinamibacterales bacterium]
MGRLFLTLTILLSVSSPALAQIGPPGPPSIITRGHATLKRVPNQAWVQIAAETRATSPAEAQRLAADAMTSVQAALGKAGIAADAMKTTGYSLQPDIEWSSGRSRVRGYIARNQIEIRVDALDRLGPVIDAAGSSGATSMSGLRFDLKERDAVEREALALAVQDAMARAKAIAAGVGATLGPILRIDEQGEMAQPVPYMTMRAEAAAPAQTPISLGEIEIRVSVTLTVAIGARNPTPDVLSLPAVR